PSRRQRTPERGEADHDRAKTRAPPTRSFREKVEAAGDLEVPVSHALAPVARVPVTEPQRMTVEHARLGHVDQALARRELADPHRVFENGDPLVEGTREQGLASNGAVRIREVDAHAALPARRERPLDLDLLVGVDASNGDLTSIRCDHV